MQRWILTLLVTLLGVWTPAFSMTWSQDLATGELSPDAKTIEELAYHIIYDEATHGDIAFFKSLNEEEGEGLDILVQEFVEKRREQEGSGADTREYTIGRGERRTFFVDPYDKVIVYYWPNHAGNNYLTHNIDWLSWWYADNYMDFSWGSRNRYGWNLFHTEAMTAWSRTNTLYAGSSDIQFRFDLRCYNKTAIYTLYAH